MLPVISKVDTVTVLMDLQEADANILVLQDGMVIIVQSAVFVIILEAVILLQDNVYALQGTMAPDVNMLALKVHMV